jgi:hypothetical protein
MVRTFAKRWAVLAIALPLVAAGARRLSQSMEARKGPSRTSRLLRTGADVIHQVTGRAPAKRRRWF